MIDPFFNPTGTIAKHISRGGLKIYIWLILIFHWEYLGMSEVGSNFSLTTLKECSNFANLPFTGICGLS